MKTIGQILEENNLMVDLVYNKAMTERVYKSMEEYAQQFKPEFPMVKKTALQCVNEVEPNGELLTTDMAVAACEMYAEQCKPDAKVMQNDAINETKLNETKLNKGNEIPLPIENFKVYILNEYTKTNKTASRLFTTVVKVNEMKVKFLDLAECKTKLYNNYSDAWDHFINWLNKQDLKVNGKPSRTMEEVEKEIEELDKQRKLKVK